jgi:uncharacterized protein (TIGR02246 family)
MTDQADLERRLCLVEDELALRGLLAAYAFAADRNDGEAWLALFANDAFMDIAGMGRFEGRQALRELIDELLSHNADGAHQHHPTGPIVFEIDGDRAAAYSYSLVVSVMPTSPVSISSASFSRWEFRREGGRWRVAGRTIQPLTPDSIPAILASGFGVGGER